VRTLAGKPSNLATLRDAVHVIRELGNSRAVEHNGRKIQFPWSKGSALEVWVAAYGPLALKLTGEVGDGFILQCADPDVAAWMIRTVRDAAERVGRDPDAIKFCVAAPMYVGDGDSPAARAHMREQCRWFGGMVGNHVADIVSKYGQGSTVPKALTDYIEGRQGYDYNEHGRAGNSHTQFVPDEIVERFCLLGSPREHVEKLQALRELGVTQFAGYLQHDNKDETLRMYGERVIPAMAEHVVATA
jgi:probable F420-dependent oxidoreductase